MISHEPIMRALKKRLYENLPEFNTISRRFRTPANVSPPEMPALFIVEPNEQRVRSIEGLPEIAMLEIDLYFYIDAGQDPNDEPISAMNVLLDKIADALKPDYPEPLDQVCTLGGLVQHCWIEGTVEKDPGDLTGKGICRVPIKITVP